MCLLVAVGALSIASCGSEADAPEVDPQRVAEIGDRCAWGGSGSPNSDAGPSALATEIREHFVRIGDEGQDPYLLASQQTIAPGTILYLVPTTDTDKAVTYGVRVALSATRGGPPVEGVLMDGQDIGLMAQGGEPGPCAQGMIPADLAPGDYWVSINDGDIDGLITVRQ